MKKCVFIIPYFGKFKNYFPVFLDSCSHNCSYDWIIFTDNDDVYNYPKNVRKIRMTFDKFRQIIQEKFSFEINLETPYKLCDYKPAYGYVFEEMIKQYDYWGYCDCDLVFGSMERFLSNVLEAGYDKVFAGGHCTIYKNSFENNRRFMKANSLYGELYKQAYTNSRIFAFDEMCYGVNVHTLFLDDGARVFAKDLSFNVSTDSYMFRRKYFNENNNMWIEESENKYIVYDEGHVYAGSMKMKSEPHQEYLYVHFQNRKFKIDDTQNSSTRHVVFLPEKILCYNEMPKDSSLFAWNVKCLTINRFLEFCRKYKRKLFNPQFFYVNHNPYEEESNGISAIKCKSSDLPYSN